MRTRFFNKGEKMKNFRCYQLAKTQYLRVKTLKLPRYQADQLQRASLSVFLNLAEGSGKSGVKDRRRFYEIALASHREVQALIDLIELTELNEVADRLGGGLFNLVRQLTAEAVNLRIPLAGTK